jgi:hypothetical protein
MNSEIEVRFERNIVRVRHLVEIYQQTTPRRQGRRTIQESDVLRAAVVLLHAAVEDVLRSLERRTLPNADSRVLNEIPLAGMHRAAKFNLGDLAKFRGKTVERVIDESVDGYLQRMTYNSAEEFAEVLTRLGVPVDEVNSEFRVLDQFMKRRHQIVHRADREDSRGRGRHGAASLSPAQVQQWSDVAERFIQAIFMRVPDITGPAP